MSDMKFRALATSAETDPSAAVELDNEINRKGWKLFRKRSHSLAGAIGGVGIVSIVATKIGFVAPASAEVINTTQITEILTSMIDIFPAIGNLVIAIVPTLITLGLVAFILKFFDEILGAISGCMSVFRR